MQATIRPSTVTPVLSLLHSFEELRAQAPQLWRDAAGGELFLDPAWFELLARDGLAEAGAAAPAPQLLLLNSAGPLCLPLLRRADGLHSLSNYYSCRYGLLGAEPGSGLAPADALALGRALRGLPGGARLRLQPLAPEDGQLRSLAEGLRAAGYWVDRFFCFGNWVLPCAGLDFEGYMQGRASALRHSIERGRRRLTRAGAWEIEICCGADTRLQSCLSDFEAVYAASWKGAESHPGFVRALVRLLAERGWLRLGVLRSEGRALAAQLWWVSGGRANIYKLAYREDAGRFSAGSILTAALMQRVLEQDRVTEVDYLSGDDAYKRDWMSQRRERWGLLAFDPRTVPGLAGAVRHFGGVAWRRLRLTAGRSPAR